MRRRALALLAGILVLASIPGPVLADSVVDQMNPAHVTNFSGTRTFAQTVTVGKTGMLTGVDLYMSATSATQITASIMSLYRGSGYPFGPVLASATVQVSAQTWYHFEFPTPVSFISGGHFAIVFAVIQSSAKASAGMYSGGQALEYGAVWAPLNGDANLDFAFRTYVAAPVPTATPPSATAEPVATPPSATAEPVATATPTTTVPGTSAATTDLTASPMASIANATPTALPDPQSGGSGDSGVPPILLAFVGIVALTAALGGIGLWFVRARRLD
jgi:hypothetical protein